MRLAPAVDSVSLSPRRYGAMLVLCVALLSAGCGSDSGSSALDGAASGADAAVADGSLADVGGDAGGQSDTLGSLDGKTGPDAQAGSDAQAPKGCVNAAVDCPKPDACETVACVNGKCKFAPVETPIPCDDKDACSVDDKCAGKKCKGKPLSCDDGNPCTDDGCLSQSGCVHIDSKKPCSDGGKCEKFGCVGGACVKLPGSPCDDGNPCTADTCDPKLGCAHAILSKVVCDDQNGCTVGDKCDFGQCVGAGGKDCSDGNVCTTDACDPAGDCTHTVNSLPCNDGDACTKADVCAGGVCSGKAKACDDGDPCTADTCNAKTGQCVFAKLGDGAVCQGGPCVVDAVCSAGKCAGTPKACDDGSPCTVDACDLATDSCTSTAAEDGAGCGSGDGCFANASCKAGVCLPPAAACDDANACTTDACGPTGCGHEAVADGTSCGATGETCVAGVCT
jgi:hypothetical protein